MPTVTESPSSDIPLPDGSCIPTDRLGVAKHLMQESARLFLGIQAEGLQTTIQTADASQLRSVLAQWHMAIRASGKVGPHVIDEYVSAVKRLMYMD